MSSSCFGESRYYGFDGTGGTCRRCDRFFGTQFALDLHQNYCSSLLLWKREAQEAGSYQEPDKDDEKWCDGLTVEYSAWSYSVFCLNHLNQQSGANYKLVKPGNYQMEAIRGGLIIHLNFQATTDFGYDETFFAQVRSLGPRQNIDCLVSLGPTSQLPPLESAYLRGCQYCESVVHHPVPGTEGCTKLNLGLLRREEVSEFN